MRSLGAVQAMFSQTVNQKMQSLMQGNGPDVSRRLSDMTLAEKMAKFKNAAGKIDTDEMTRSLSFPLEETDSLMTRESLPLKDKMQVWICKTGSVSV